MRRIPVFNTITHFCILCHCCSLANGHAQVFGGHPPSQKWLQINTDSVRVIFAPGLEKMAGEIVDITQGTK